MDNEFVFTTTLISENGEFVEGLTNGTVFTVNVFEVSEGMGGKTDIE